MQELGIYVIIKVCFVWHTMERRLAAKCQNVLLTIQCKTVSSIPILV